MSEFVALIQILFSHLPQLPQLCIAYWPLARARLCSVQAALRPARNTPRPTWRWYDQHDFEALIARGYSHGRARRLIRSRMRRTPRGKAR